MVPDLYVAWHAGKSSWKNYISLNKPVFPMTIASADEKTGFILLRKKESRKEIFKTIICVF